MLAAILGLFGALVYGAADFFGGIAARRTSSIRVAAIAAVSGIVVLACGIPFLGAGFSAASWLWGSLSGLSGAVALGLYYACLAIGPMSVLSPIAALVSALVPVVVGLGRGEQFGVLGYLGLALGMVAVVLIAFTPERGAARPTLRGLTLAVGAGLGFGLYLVLIELSPAADGIGPLLVNRLTNATIMTLVALGLAFAARRVGDRVVPLTAGLGIAVVCGVLDATANVVILMALRIGELSVVGVLNALYPAGTVVLAALVLRERLAPVQWAGLVLALIASGLFAVG